MAYGKKDSEKYVIAGIQFDPDEGITLGDITRCAWLLSDPHFNIFEIEGEHAIACMLVDSTFEALLTAEDANIIRNKIVSILNDTGLENPDGKYFVNLPDGTTVAFCLNY